MRAHTAGLLVIATFAQSALGALPWGILRRASDHLSPNATAVTPAAGDATGYVTVSLITQGSVSSLASSYPTVQSALSEPAHPSSLRTNSTGSHVEASGPGPSLGTTKSVTATSDLHLIKSSTERSSPVTAELESSSRRVSAANRVKRPPSTPASITIAANSTTNLPGSTTSPIPTPHQSSISASSTFWNTTQAPNRTATSTSADDSKTCTELTGDEPVTEYSIVYTATITLSGNYSHYTPPYPTIETPTYCGIGVTLSSGPFFTTIAAGSGGFIVSTKQTAAACSGSLYYYDCDGDDTGDSKAADSYRGKIVPTASSTRMTVTFITTEKNPATVTASEAPPGFGVSGSVGFSIQQHQSVASGDGGNGGSRGSGGRVNGPQSQQKETSQPTPQPTFTITARADNVVINDKTFSSLKPDQTTTVTLSEGTFTILPTVVVGEGATVQKPQPIGTAISVLTPVTGSVGGLPVIVSGSEAIVDGTTFEIPPLGTTTTIHNELITAGPGQVVVDDQTITFKAAGGAQSDVVVTGAEMVTAIGQSIFVYHSTTLTYGPGIPETTKLVDSDTITVGPSGVVVHGTTLGGIAAKATSTRYEIVGGATITKLSPSYVVISGTTFTAGLKSETTTKVIGGETITIGPKGVSISTMTLSLPFGSSTVTTIKASTTKTDSLPSETGGSKNKGGGDGSSSQNNNEDDEDNKGSMLKPSLVASITGLCMAIGVWVWL